MNKSLWTLLTTFSLLQAQDLSIDDLFKLSLDELLEVKVDITSKTLIDQNKAPGIVRVFTDKDIKRYDFKTIKELLATVPSWQISDFSSGDTGLFVRGVQGRKNSKVLLLIDGIPMRNLYWGHSILDQMIPMANIKRVEVLNGPGSVLYGSNAFAGVIKITTKSDETMVQAETGIIQNNNVNASGHNIPFYNVSASKAYDEWYMFANGYYTKGFEPELNKEGEVGNQKGKVTNLNAQLKYKGEHFSLITSISSYEHPYSGSKSNKQRNFTHEPLSVIGEYENDGFRMNAYINYYRLIRKDNSYVTDKQSVLTKEKESERTGYLLGSEIEYTYTTQDNELITGLSLLRSKATQMDSQTLFPTSSTKQQLLNNEANDDISLYMQNIYQINEAFSFTAGLRASYLNTFDNQFHYRLGLNYYENDNYAKVLYATAFRAPTYREYNKQFDNPTYTQKNDLSPETLSSLELQVGHKFQKANLNLTFYHNEYKDFIKDLETISVNGVDLVDGVKSDEYSYNFDKIITSGLEFSAQVYPNEDLSLSLSASAILSAKEKSGDIQNVILAQPFDTNEHDIYFLSKYTASLNSQYMALQDLAIGLNILYYSHRDAPDNYQSSVNISAQNTSNLDAYTLFNTYADYAISQKSNIRLSIKNMFDTTTYSQPLSDPSEYDLQNPGRSVHLLYSYLF